MKKRHLKTKYTKKQKNLSKKSSFGFFKILVYMFLFFIFASFILGVVVYNKYIKGLASVDNLENLNLSQSSIMYDRNQNELYNIFQEKRTYIEYEKISKHMIHAIISGEDKKFWDNMGVDPIGIMRAGLNYLTKKDETIGGTSTITQQLIKNTLLTNERSIERKIKEMYLSYQLTKKFSKEKILELYLNKISFGHNAYGVEQAAKTFFNKQAKDLNILESSIIASLPKGPTLYSPYNNRINTLGAPYILQNHNNQGGPAEGEYKIKLLNEKEIANNKAFINKLAVTINKMDGMGNLDKLIICNIKKENLNSKYANILDSDGCLELQYSSLRNFLESIRVQSGERVIAYESGRKDYILQRMLEDRKISFSEYKDAIIQGMIYKLHTNKERIKYPHFVFYVKEQLEKQLKEEFGEDIIETGGLRIYTSIDPDLQDQAENIIKKYVAQNAKAANAKNAALISIDNKTGDVLAMVGAVDYYNKDIEGNVNVTTSMLQPGSTFKPFVYSLAMNKGQIGTRTPVYDLKTNFGGYIPKNFDGRFKGKMTVATALNHSRNIPAIKMFFKAGGAKDIVDYVHLLGGTSLPHNKNYGAAMALGTGLMKPIDMAQAYSTFANLGEKVTINPILKVVDSQGNIIYEKKPEKKQVIPQSQAYIINHILSDTTARPASWNKELSLPGRPVAAKTGTSTKPVAGRKYDIAANLWTLGYTPQITTVVWAGNSDGENLFASDAANGLERAGPIWNAFMKAAHQGRAVEKWQRPKGVKSISISEITGYLPNGANSAAKVIASLFINAPTKVDKSYENVEVDLLCNGKVTEKTPKEAIKKVTFLEFHSLEPTNKAWENPVQAWAQSATAIEQYGESSALITAIKDTACDRKGDGTGGSISSNFLTNKPYYVGENSVDLTFGGDKNIKKVEVFVNGSLSKTIEVQEGAKTASTKVFFPASYMNQKIDLELKMIDDEFYTYSEKKTVTIGGTDNSKPKISLTNPKTGKIQIYKDSFFNLRASANDDSGIAKIEISLDGKIIASSKESKIVTPINDNLEMKAGTYLIKVIATDNRMNSSETIIPLKIMERGGKNTTIEEVEAEKKE